MEILKRYIIDDFLAWSKSPIRSPLLLLGVRQSGKTTILRNFSRQIARKVVEVNFWKDADDRLKNIFKKNGAAKKIIKELKDYFELSDFDLEQDVLFIDEIQESPEAYSALKSFKEEMPQLKIMATGSYLQLFLKNEKLLKLPVGCVDEYMLRPLSFSEFLLNFDQELHQKFQTLDIHSLDLTESLHMRFMSVFRDYLFCGGMPEVAFLFMNSPSTLTSLKAVRKKQKDLLKQYVSDFQKYGKSSHIKKIDKLFQSIPRQLEQSMEETVGRFYYRDLGTNANYNVFHWPFSFLTNAGLIIKSYIVSKNDLPFRVHEQNEERSIFKCFYFDVGLLNAALDTPVEAGLGELGPYKGFIAENFVAQQLYLQTSGDLISYKRNEKQDAAELEFLISQSGGIVPIEVKSSAKSLRSKSLDSYILEHAPKRAYKLVPVNTYKDSPYFQIPIYLVEKILNSFS